jgi:triphosphoribosyl-dephospho-CoA synthase
MMDRAALVEESAFMAAMLEVSAPKPGNVSPSHSHGKTRFEHFIASSAAIAPVMGKIAGGDYFLGQGMFHAINRSMSVQHGGNVHLGVVLLFGPVASAAGSSESMDAAGLRRELTEVLRSSTYKDAVYTYNAMKHASASGIPQEALSDDSLKEIIGEHTSLLEWMKRGSENSSVAREYATDYELTFELVLPTIKDMLKKGSGIMTAIVHSYIVLLSMYPDTHIASVHGEKEATELRDFVKDALKGGGNPEKLEEIRKFIEEKGYNPGASADLVATALFIGILSGEISV